MAQNVLSGEVKVFVAQHLACFDPPSVVVRAVKDAFDLVVSPQQVETYDPTKRAGASLSQELREVFEETRATFLADTAAIGIANKAVRLRTLARLAERAERQGNLVLTASLVEQAAKEAGGAFTNRRELTGADGKAIQTEVSVTPDVTALDQAGRDALRTVLDQLSGDGERA